MPTKRPVGLYGRLPVKPVGERFDIKYLGAYLPEPLPAPQYPVDVSAGIKDWKMLGNGPDPTLTDHEPVGDCCFAGREHLKMAKAAAYQETETWESSNDLVTEYLAYDGGQDVGANIADLLLFWFKTGKILAFAPVDITDPVQVDAAVQAFHGVYAGVNLPESAEEQFAHNKPWAYDGSPIAGGHCIVKVGADGEERDTWVTWGALQESTTEWTLNCLEEAWAIITPEDAEAVGLDVEPLLADIRALRGTV